MTTIQYEQLLRQKKSFTDLFKSQLLLKNVVGVSAAAPCYSCKFVYSFTHE